MNAFLNGFGRGLGLGFGFSFMNWCCPSPFYMGWGMPMPPIFTGMFGGYSPMMMPQNNVYYYYGKGGGDGIGDTYTPSRAKTVTTQDAEYKVATKEQKPIKEEPPKVSKEGQILYNRWSMLKVVSEDLTPEFCDKVIKVANNVKCKPEDLMAILYVESRFDHTFTSKSNDKEDTYVGLIRFKHKDRDTSHEDSVGLDVTISELKNMTAIEQLDYVEKYISKRKKEQNAALTLENLAEMICYEEAETNKMLYAKSGTEAYSKNKNFNNVDTDKNKKDKVIDYNELVAGLEQIKCNIYEN